METLLTSCVIAAIILLLIVWNHKMKRVQNPLPGPTGFPILGYLPFMGRKPYEKLFELSKTYGPVYKIRIGMRDILVLCDFQNIKEAFANDAFYGRPRDLAITQTKRTIRTGAIHGLQWKYQKNVLMDSLKTLGYGRTTMEDNMKEEILELLDLLKGTSGKSSKFTDMLSMSTSNNIANWLFGRRFNKDDPNRLKLCQNLRQIELISQNLSWQSNLPLLKAVLVKLEVGNWGKLKRAVESMNQFMLQEIREHEQTLDPNNIRDFIDAYLLEIKSTKNDPKSPFHEDILLDLTRGFFGAGSGTIRFSIEWMLLLAAEHPEIQKKMQEEIDNTLGTDAFPKGQDQQRLPYVDAAIQEMWRWTSMIALNAMRYTLQDTELNGYHVPKDLCVTAVYYGVNNCKELWGDDIHIFKPERFLSEDGRKVKNFEHALPFSIGKRACPAKPLGKLEVFLYVVAILQKFNISPPPGKKIDFEGNLGVGLMPKEQELRITIR